MHLFGERDERIELAQRVLKLARGAIDPGKVQPRAKLLWCVWQVRLGHSKSRLSSGKAGFVITTAIGPLARRY